MVYDDGAIAGTKAEYDKLLEKIKDITDSWVGKMRSGVPPPTLFCGTLRVPLHGARLGPVIGVIVRSPDSLSVAVHVTIDDCC